MTRSSRRDLACGMLGAGLVGDSNERVREEAEEERRALL